ncbi:DUF3054 domain-containing protein [soil metagenome]
MSKRGVIAAAFDIFTVVLFVAIGRRNHDEAEALPGVLRVAAPFLIGLGCGWVVARAWKAPTAIRTGLIVWPVTVLAGMLLRHFAFDNGTALSFIIVATTFLGVVLVGWRALYTFCR